MLYRIRFTVAGLIMLSFLWMFIMSCDPVRDHEALTFFFDGVPPLEGETVTSKDVPVLDANTPDSQAEQAQAKDKEIWYTHNPEKGCEQCHKKIQGSQWAVPEFVEPVPELCYSGCHDDYTKSSAAYVHGPVASGECLLCHDAHQSRNKHLLKEPESKLCFQCHGSEVMELLKDHSVESPIGCTECHDAHASSVKGLLKTD